MGLATSAATCFAPALQAAFSSTAKFFTSAGASPLPHSCKTVLQDCEESHALMLVNVVNQTWMVKHMHQEAFEAYIDTLQVNHLLYRSIQFDIKGNMVTVLLHNVGSRYEKHMTCRGMC
jgi:hypothetical protein